MNLLLRHVLGALSLLTLVALTGCSGEDEYKAKPNPIYQKVVPDSSVDVTKGMTAGPVINTAEAVGVKSYGGGLTSPLESDHNYVDKADIYWKLNWMTQDTENGMFSPDFLPELDKLQSRLRDTEMDDKLPLIQEIIKDFRDAMEADKIAKDFRKAGLDAHRLPWANGRLGLEKSLNDTINKNPGNAYFAPPQTTTRREKSLHERALAYGEKYHASPEDVKKRLLANAATKTEHLGDMLGLLGRESNTKPGDAPIRKYDVDLSFLNK